MKTQAIFKSADFILNTMKSPRRLYFPLTKKETQILKVFNENFCSCRTKEMENSVHNLKLDSLH